MIGLKLISKSIGFKMIPYGKQTITDDDINAVEKVLRSDFLTQGKTVPLFEKKLSRHQTLASQVFVSIFGTRRTNFTTFFRF